MPKKTHGLARGLDSLLPEVDMMTSGGGQEIAIGDIDPNPDQPRRAFSEESIAQLAQSIREQGLLQPILVVPMNGGRYRIVAGERRWRAARIAGLAEVPAIVIEADDRKMTELSLIENLQREDLDPIEEAEGYRVLTEQYGMTQDECAQRVGKSRPTVANALRLLGLTEPVRAMVEDGRLSAGHARALLTLGSKQQQAAAETVVKDALSVRQTELLVKKLTAEKKEKPQKDALSVNYVEEAARELGEKLGRPCRIVNGKKKGRIELEYYGTEDLNALLEALEKLGKR